MGEFEARARVDYSRHLGRELLVQVVYGYRGDDSVDCFPVRGGELRVRVAPTSDGDLCHWNDEWLDPYWNVEVLSTEDPGVAGARSFWIFGPSYTTARPLAEQDGERHFRFAPTLGERMVSALATLVGLRQEITR